MHTSSVSIYYTLYANACLRYYNAIFCLTYCSNKHLRVIKRVAAVLYTFGVHCGGVERFENT